MRVLESIKREPAMPLERAQEGMGGFGWGVGGTPTENRGNASPADCFAVAR